MQKELLEQLRKITEEEKNERVRGGEKAVRTSFDWAKGE